ncbi:DUF3369 domain-containing protein, partial [Staphylococcus aureus]
QLAEQLSVEGNPLDVQAGLLGAGFHQLADAIDDLALVLYCQNPRHHLLFHIETTRQLSQMDMGLLSLFTENIIVALENIRLNEVIADNQREI